MYFLVTEQMCLVSTTDICALSTTDIGSVSTNDIYHISTCASKDWKAHYCLLGNVQCKMARRQKLVPGIILLHSFSMVFPNDFEQFRLQHAAEHETKNKQMSGPEENFPTLLAENSAKWILESLSV